MNCFSAHKSGKVKQKNAQFGLPNNNTQYRLMSYIWKWTYTYLFYFLGALPNALSQLRLWAIKLVFARSALMARSAGPSSSGWTTATAPASLSAGPSPAGCTKSGFTYNILVSFDNFVDHLIKNGYKSIPSNITPKFRLFFTSGSYVRVQGDIEC